MKNFDEAEEWSIGDLKRRTPQYSSSNILSVKQYFNIVCFTITLFLLILSGYRGFVLILNIFSFLFFAYRLLLTIIGLCNMSNDDDEVSYHNDLPLYCILLPMRNENVEVVEELIKNISNIEYPSHKLDVIMLVDSDDEYLEEITKLQKPEHFRIISASKQYPFTKPKVCNLGLYYTDAEYVTIYDAEDKPEPKQLLKVLKAFQDEDVECVQCRLHYNNKRSKLLSSFFNLEYLAWFGVTIKGLERLQKSHPIIPLGGTSQHLRTSTLKNMSGWDAFNVTEDCDLGIRLARSKRKIKNINSITEEIAVERLKDFMPQRTRWQLGFMVTYLSHTRNIRQLYKDIGFTKMFHFYANIFGSFLAPAITPVLFIIFILNLFNFGRGETYINWLPWITIIGNYLMIVLVHLLSSIRLQRGKYCLLSLFQPFYYLIQSITVYRAFYKLLTAPNKWEKTNHVVDK